MGNDLTDYQAEAIAHGYTHDFGIDGRSAPSDLANELRVVEYVTFDSGTDPGDEVTIYLIKSTSGLNGYLILSDSFHADPRKAAFIDALFNKRFGRVESWRGNPIEHPLSVSGVSPFVPG